MLNLNTIGNSPKVGLGDCLLIAACAQEYYKKYNKKLKYVTSPIVRDILKENPYFQIGESKYGKPVLDRVLTPNTSLDEAAKCALVSMDSTMKSNLSVGAPLDLVVYEADRLATDRVVCIDMGNPYYRMLHESWGQKLREAFDSLPPPAWGDEKTDTPLRVAQSLLVPLRKITRAEEKLI